MVSLRSQVAQLVPQTLFARQKLTPCVRSTDAGSRLGNGVRAPGETSAASRDLRVAREPCSHPACTTKLRGHAHARRACHVQPH